MLAYQWSFPVIQKLFVLTIRIVPPKPTKGKRVV